MYQDKIDFVMPWVDGSDIEWQKEKAKYSGTDFSDASIARYRDWDNLQYWFRGVEKFTPWVNKIHFITYGHLPKWLNVNHPKLQIVNHKDYIPEKYLPVFSARPIELNVHRIPELSDQFVFFNDDCFILKEMKPETFFKDGLPCDTAALTVLECTGSTHAAAFFNTMRIINRHFTKNQVVFGNKKKWFSLKYGKQLIRTLLLLPWQTLPSFYNAHGPNSYTKEIFETVWAAEPEELDRTCSNRFREITDVTQFLMKAWQLCEGKFQPRGSLCRSIFLTMPKQQLQDLILGRKSPIVCLNDTNDIDNFEEIKNETNSLLNQILPEKSSFEL